MEIRIKTAQEFHDSHVTIEIVAEDQGEVAQIAQVLDPGTLGRLAGQEDRIADLEAQLRQERNCHVCTASCTPNAHVAFQGRQRVEQLETQLELEKDARQGNLEWAERAELRAEEFDQQRRTHLERANQLEVSVTELRELLAAKDRVIEGIQDDTAIWQERVRNLRQSVESRDGLLATATAHIGDIVNAVYTPEVSRALGKAATQNSLAMARAISAVRRSTAPWAPVEPTSQA